MNKFIELSYAYNKIVMNLIIFGLKEEKEEDTIALVKGNYKKT